MRVLGGPLVGFVLFCFFFFIVVVFCFNFIVEFYC